MERYLHTRADSLRRDAKSKPVQTHRTREESFIDPWAANLNRAFGEQCFLDLEKKGNAMRKGFTMLEVLTSLLIIAGLASILIPRFTTTTLKVQQRQAESYLRAIRMAEKMYYARNGQYVACANAAAITTTLGTVLRNDAARGYSFSVASSPTTTFTATADYVTGTANDLTLDQDGVFKKNGATYTPP
jgi:type IV pilus assembly protein PilE